MLAAAAGFATGFFRPASYAGLPNLVTAADLADANSRLRAGEYLSWTIGTAFGGLIVAASSPDVAYWVNAVTFLFSAGFILRIAPSLLQATRAESRGHWRDLGDGFSMVFRTRVLLAVFCAWNLVMLANAGINVAEIVLAKVDFSSGDVGFGLLWAASGLGLLLGSLYAPRWLELRGILLVYTGALVLMGFGALTTAVAPTVWVALPCMVLGGAGNGAAVVYNSLLVQRGAPDELRGRVFTVIMSTNFALLGLGMIVAGPLTDADRRTLGVRHLGRLRRARRARGLSPSSLRSRRRNRTRRVSRGLGARLVAKRGDWTRESLVAGIGNGDRRALARAISLVENGDALAAGIVHDLYPSTGRARTIGVTGPPGVGKSTLIASLVRHARGLGQTAGVISVDPSSPFSQGALLGDRIRLSDHFLDPGVFIRSMGTRGHLGGLAEATLQALLLLDAAGKDVVFVETVGTGQSEVEVVRVADTVLLVLMPGSGDSIQALKAGIMEIPDVIAVNKADHPAAKTMVADVRSILALDHERAWKPPIVLTEAVGGEGVEALWDRLGEHRSHLEKDGLLDERRREHLAAEVFAVSSARAKTHLEHAVRDDPELARVLEAVQRRELDPLSAVSEILEKVFRIDTADRG